jgi:enoyl-CoA hydratase
VVKSGAFHGEVIGSALVIRLDRPPVNALDADTLHELADRLDAARSAAVASIVLTGTGSVFSAGADLVRVLEADAADVDAGIDALSRAFEALFVFPRPVVAAVNGHALAGGAILTCCCDYRIMSSAAGTIGAVELRAGVPFPAWALEVLRHAVNNHHLQEVVFTGRAYTPDDALTKGLIDEVVPEAELMARALQMADELAAVPPVTYSLMKEALRRPAIDAAVRGTSATDDQIKAAWGSGEVQDAIRKLLASLGG